MNDLDRLDNPDHLRHSRAGLALVLLGIIHPLRAAYGLAFVMLPQKRTLTNLVPTLGLAVAIGLLAIWVGFGVRKGRRTGGAIALACFFFVGLFIWVGVLLWGNKSVSLLTYVVEGINAIWIVVTLVLVFRLLK